MAPLSLAGVAAAALLMIRIGLLAPGVVSGPMRRDRRGAPLVDVVRPRVSGEQVGNAEDLHTGSPV